MPQKTKTFQRSPKQWHQLLADYFEILPTWQKEPTRIVPKSDGLPTHRKMSELAYQLIKAKHKERLEVILSDLRFIEAKCVAGMVFELLREYNQTLELFNLPSAAQMRRALTLALPGLINCPGLAMQSIYNRLFWFIDIETGIQSKLYLAFKYLNQRQFWIKAMAPLPGTQTRDSAAIPFQTVSSIQSISPSAKTIAIASIGGLIEIRSLPEGELLAKRSVNTSRLAAITLIDDTSNLAYMNQDGTVYSNDGTKSFDGRKGERLIAFLPLHGIIIACSDNSLVAWDNDKIKLMYWKLICRFH
ncbi:MAG: hypothetical protein IPO69_22155 [Saprospiraceae bacterium]|nr:hypothetical protein [Saprospiraceae bacterium]